MDEDIDGRWGVQFHVHDKSGRVSSRLEEHDFRHGSSMFPSVGRNFAQAIFDFSKMTVVTKHDHGWRQSWKRSPWSKFVSVELSLTKLEDAGGGGGGAADSSNGSSSSGGGRTDKNSI